MDWRLIEYAKEAEDTAAGLHVFLSEIPQYSKDITGEIAELFAISNALHTLDESLDPTRYGVGVARIQRDLEIVLPSLGHTLDDVRDMFSKSKKKRRPLPGAFPGTPPYARIWEEACADFQVEGIPLPVRLELYRAYLQDLFDILKGKPRASETDYISSRLSALLEQQEPYVQEPIESYFSRVHISDSRGHGSRTPMPPSPKHVRPTISHYQTYPNYAHPPPPPPAPLPPYPAGFGDMPFIPPPVPEIPHSPTYSTASSQTFSTHSNDSSSTTYWAMKIFDGRHTATPLSYDHEITTCYGRDEPRALEFLDEDHFQKVLQIPFETSNVFVRLYWRPEDKRARILFLTKDLDGNRQRFCFLLTGLKVLRKGSCLNLCRVNRQDGKLDLWANLRFTLYERMVLFYCTFVAMKHQDEKYTSKNLDDFFQPGEKQEYGGEIQDNGSLHAFRIFRDEDSGGVRFEATARRGPFKTVPIWTAFVTRYIGVTSWMHRVGHSTVQFQELHPYVFHQGYTLPKGPSGKYQLTFTTPEDARNFIQLFHRIRTH